MKAAHSVIRDEGPRTALAISLITHKPLDSTLHYLRTLEAEGQIRHKTDEAGVMRWELVEEEQGPAMELGAEILLRGHYEPTVEQTKRLGL
jgi:hypothetical protein